MVVKNCLCTEPTTTTFQRLSFKSVEIHYIFYSIPRAEWSRPLKLTNKGIILNFLLVTTISRPGLPKHTHNNESLICWWDNGYLKMSNFLMPRLNVCNWEFIGYTQVLTLILRTRYVNRGIGLQLNFTFLVSCPVVLRI